MALPIPIDAAPDDRQLGREIILLSAQMNVANYHLLKKISRFDVRGGWRCGGAMKSCAHWLAANCGMTIGAARERVRAARCLEALPEVDAAFANGELSYSKVRAITRVATPENQGFMVMMAQEASASHLENLVSRYQPVEDPVVAALEADGVFDEDEADSSAVGDGATEGDDEARREQARELYWFQDEDGMWVIHAKLPPEQGQLVMKALKAISRPIQEERQEEWKAKQRERMKAVARKILQRHRLDDDEAPVGHPIERGGPCAPRTIEGETGTAAGFDDLTKPSQQYHRAEEKISAETFSQFMNHVRADAFVGMVEHFLSSAPDYRELQGLKGAERCQVVLHVDVNTLREQRSGVCCPHAKAYFEDKPWISAETARRLSCDASLVTVLEDEGGGVLNVGRRSRVVPGHIRRALMERDGVCQYPGCHESRYVDAHHIVHWADGGETSLDNLVILCRHHHRQLHRGSFDLAELGVSAETFSDKSQVKSTHHCASG
jgi:hypothetical protein